MAEHKGFKAPIPDRTPAYCKNMLIIFERVGLIGIMIATLIAAGQEVAHMVNARTVTLGDLLLMFIYLEVLAMVAVYFESGQLPVRFPIYIGIIALARYLILDMKSLDEWRILSVAVAILILAIAVLVLRYGHLRFPYPSWRRKQPLDEHAADDPD